MKPNTLVLSTDTVKDDKVKNAAGQDLGSIKEIMLDVRNGRISYAVLSFGGFMGLGDKLFAVPWEALKLNTAEKAFYLDVPKERLEDAPGFDEDNWPDFANPEWGRTVYDYYGINPYWLN